MELKKIICGLVVAMTLYISSVVSASEILIPQTPLYNYHNSIQIQEEFISGGTATTAIGLWGWGSGGGTITYPNSETNRFGILRIDTTAVISTISRIALEGNNGISFDSTVNHLLTWIIRLNTNDANTTVRFGVSNDWSNSPVAHGIFIEKQDADTNWFCSTVAGGAPTRVNSGVAVTTSFVILGYLRNSAGVQFIINGVPVCSIINTTMPSVYQVLGGHIVNSAAASKTVDIDYSQLQIFGIVR